MPGIDIIVFLLVVIVAFSAIVERLNIPQSVMLVVVGLIIGFTPQLPNAELKPDTVFLVFLPPLLFTAAWKLSWHDFKAERRAALSLATGLVFFTTIAIAAVAHYFIPGFSWQLGFLMGAIISPPDAVAATSVTKGLNLNKRILTILEGESLINDASALVAYRYAMTAVVTGTFIFWQAALQFLWLALGGTAIGLIIAWALLRAHRYLNNATIEVALTLLTPYAAYLFAEHFHLSGVLAVVAAGLYISFRSPESFSFQTRMQANSFWETIEFLLNGFIFILIGMQLPGIIANMDPPSLFHAIAYGLLITSVAIIVRILWVFPGAYIPVWLARKDKQQIINIDWKSVLIISWTGMRGVVSLASAMAIPLSLANGDAFPQRRMILLITFCVIFFTLAIHGLSLRLLIRFLGLRPDGLDNADENKVRYRLATQVLSYIDQYIATNPAIDEDVLKRLRNKFEINQRIIARKEKGELSPKGTGLLQAYTRAQKDVLDYERAILIQMQREGSARSSVLKKLEYELDIEESRLNEQMKRVKRLEE